MSKGRSLYMPIFQNFINSFKSKKEWGVLVGRDHLGTEYYESEKSLNSRRRSRWFIPVDKESFDVDVPTEWQSWLHYKRKEPPTEEEIQENQLKMQQNIENAKKLKTPKNVKKEEIKTFEKPAFPVYEEYTTQPMTVRKKDSR